MSVFKNKFDNVMAELTSKFGEVSVNSKTDTMQKEENLAGSHNKNIEKETHAASERLAQVAQASKAKNKIKRTLEEPDIHSVAKKMKISMT